MDQSSIKNKQKKSENQEYFEKIFFLKYQWGNIKKHTWKSPKSREEFPDNLPKIVDPKPS